MLKNLLCLISVLTFAAIGCSQRTYRPLKFSLPRAGEETGCDLKIGEPFPTLQTVDLDGNTIVFDKTILGERYTLIVFWSTWCGFCMLELPHEIELSKLYQNDGLRVIGVNADLTIDRGREAAESNGVPWLNIYEGKERRISEQLGVTSWPTLLLLDSEGTVVSSTKQLRQHGPMFVNEERDTKIVHHLDYTLVNLLRGNKDITLYP